MMSGRQTCSRIRERMAAYRLGCLKEADRQATERHLAVCPTCAQEARLDERLCHLLSELPHEEAPPVTWAQVYSAKISAAPKSHRMRPLLFAVAAVSAFALSVFFRVRSPGTVTEPVKLISARHATGAVVSSLPRATVFSEAHFTLDSVDISGDPNRAVIYVAAQQTRGKMK